MDKELLVEALEFLVESEDYKSLRKLVVDSVGAPVVLTGEASILNELVSLGRVSMEALTNVLNLVERKRRAALSPKSTYQRSYVAQSRHRLAQAVKLESLVRGRKLTPTEREAYEMAVHAQWMARREQYINERLPLSWQEKNDVVRDFWNGIHAELAHDLAEAERVLNHEPAHRKRVVTPPTEPKGTRGIKLSDALKKKKK